MKNKFWKSIKDFKWERKSWYNYLLGGVVCIYIYINIYQNYAEVLEKGGDRENYLINNFFNSLTYNFNYFFGKNATLIIMGGLLFTPFIIAVVKFILWLKKRKDKNVSH